MLAILNSLGAGEAIAILVIALIVLGPEKLPDAIRKFGNIYGELRRMSQGFQSEMRDAFDEPMRELRGTAQMMQDAVNEPVKSVTADLRAPVVGGAATRPKAPADAPPAGPPEDAAAVDDQVDGTVDDQVHDQIDGTVDATATTTENGTEAAEERQAPVEDDSDEPVLAQAGLMVSEPELTAGTRDAIEADGTEKTDGTGGTDGTGDAAEAVDDPPGELADEGQAH